VFDVTVTTVTNLHFGLPELLGTLAVPFGSWWAWRSRYDLARVAAALRGRSLPGSRQEATRQLAGLQQLLTLPGPRKAPRRLP
jgi:hypothetical protein